MAGLKRSRQRDAILDNLRHRTDHPTADMVYADVRREFPSVSLGTVYRNLALLSELGLVKRLPTGTESDHYDGNVAPHDHFICRHCGCVLDIDDMIDSRKLAEEAGAGFSGHIEEASVNFYGTCGECLKKPASISTGPAGSA